MTSPIFIGDVRAKLQEMPSESVHCVWTSVPYWGLRNYETEHQVWGGVEGCAHEWGEPLHRPRNGAGRHGESSVFIKQSRAVTQAQVSGAQSTKGTFCWNCGAWKGEHGLEPTLDMWLHHEVLIWREIRRVLRKDGTAWLNCGDAYVTAPNGKAAAAYKAEGSDDRTFRDVPIDKRMLNKTLIEVNGNWAGGGLTSGHDRRGHAGALKNKQRVLMPARLAIALQDDGWWVRDEVIWAKPNPMPSSAKDRTTPAHEMIYMLSRSARYFYDHVAIQEPFADERQGRDYKTPDGWDTGAGAHGNVHKNGREKGHKGWQPVSERNRGGRTDGFTKPNGIDPSANGARNKRSVWTIPSEPYPDAHFATAPTAIVEPCLLASTSARGACAKCGAPWRRILKTEYVNPGNRTTNGPGSIERKHLEHGTAGFSTRCNRVDETLGWEPTCKCGCKDVVPCTVLDPFGGSGTTVLVARRLGLNGMMIELKPEYAAMADRRIAEGDVGIPGLA